MDLLEIYKNKNENVDWFEDHFSLAKGKAGRMFEYTNTNFRSQATFITDFQKFLEIENKPRNTWPKQDIHGQKIHEQYITNMRQSKLFKKDANEIYSRTAKGFLYSDFVNFNILEEDKWFINYLFLLNGYYFNRKNYIINRVKEDLLSFLLIVEGLTKELLVKYAKELLKTNSMRETLRSPFFYIHSFYNDSDFLINYLRSSNLEKEELAKYIEENIKNESYKCCISKKYQIKRNFNKSMLIEEIKIFLLTLLFIRSKKDVDITNICQLFIENFNQNIYILNKKLVSDYLSTNKNIFNPIFEEILELEYTDMGAPSDC